MSVTISVDDVLVFNRDLDKKQVEVLIKDGLALAERAAPCIKEPDFAYADAAIAIIRTAILRWADSGTGALTQQQNSAGPFAQNLSFDTRQTRRSLFFPSEIAELQKLCKQYRGGAFAIDTNGIPESRCTGEYSQCPYIMGSLSSPCATCGEVLRPGWWEGRR